MSVKAILASDNGFVVPAVQGKLIKLFKREERDKNGKSMSFQNGILEDATGQVRVTLFNRPELNQSYRDKFVTITAGQKGGINVKHDNWNGEQRIQLSVTGQAAITLANGAVNGNANGSAGKAEAVAGVVPLTYPNIKQRAMQFGNLYAICRKSAIVALNDPLLNPNPEPLTEEQIQGAASCIYLSITKDLDRTGPVLAGLPLVPLSRAELKSNRPTSTPPPEPDPEPAPEPEPQPSVENVVEFPNPGEDEPF